MSDSRKILVLGGGGHCKVLLGTLIGKGLEVLGVLDPSVTKGQEILGVPVLGGDEFLETQDPTDVFLVNGLGSTGDTTLRQSLFEKNKNKGFKFLSIEARSSEVAQGVDLGEGAQVLSGVIIQPGSIIEKNVILNTGCRVDHDCVVGAHSHIAPGVVMSGCVKIGKGVHVGVGASLVQGVKVGDGALIAAGATVYKDVPAKTLVMGSASAYSELRR